MLVQPRFLCSSSDPPSLRYAAILVPLAGALIQCVCLILLGYWCKRVGIFSASDARGLSAFVGRLSLPALLFLSMATLDSALQP